MDRTTTEIMDEMIEQQGATIAELLAALEPYATEFQRWKDYPKECDIFLEAMGQTTGLTTNDLRHAAEAVRKVKG